MLRDLRSKVRNIFDSSENSEHWYNAGLAAKYKGELTESLRCNQKAVELDPRNEAAWWNLGIAATALRNWPEARRAWRGFGIDVPPGDNEMRDAGQTACVRLNPSADGEVVWGERIDPARNGDFERAGACLWAPVSRHCAARRGSEWDQEIRRRRSRCIRRARAVGGFELRYL